MVGDYCGCSPDVKSLQARQRHVLTIALVINASTLLMMLAGSLYARSSFPLSGGLDNLGDALTYGLSLAVVGASLRAKARVALTEAALMLAAALAVAGQIAWRLAHPATPIAEAMSVAAFANLGANGLALYLLTPHRYPDVNMASCVAEGFAVLAAAAGVWLWDSSWPDLLIASGLLLMFLRSAVRVFRATRASLHTGEVT